MEHGGDPNRWEFIPFLVAWHQVLHTAEQTVCGCLSCFKKGGKRENAGFREVVGSRVSCGGGGSASMCSSLTWSRCPWSGDRLLLGWWLPPVTAAPEAQRSWLLLWLPHSHRLSCALLGSPQLAPTASTAVNPWISHLLGFRSLFLLQTKGWQGCHYEWPQPFSLPMWLPTVLLLHPLPSLSVPPIPRIPECVPLGMSAWQRGSVRRWPGKLRKFWAVSPAAARLLCPGVPKDDCPRVCPSCPQLGRDCHHSQEE